MLKASTESASIPLGLIAAASEADTVTNKAILGTTTLIISNEEVKNILLY